MEIKTRFAPSPTGDLHVGGIRTALYSWLFARHHNGKFVLRIEDTDDKRSNKESVNTIIDSLRWLGLDWDEGPYYQTKRIERYNQVIKQLLASGHAYRCYCSKERLQQLRDLQISKGEKARYDGHCLKNKIIATTTQPFVVRFHNPKDGVIAFHDRIRGNIEVSNQELDDLIILRSDGFPTYNFCVVVDDWDMQITHVIRGEDHINNTPRQINILKALGAFIPEYAHVSMVVGDDSSKLSKRHGTVGAMQYRDEGYIAEALINHLVRLGWSYGDQEIFSREEMIKFFSLDAVSRSVSSFNKAKLLWFNRQYMHLLPVEKIAHYLIWNATKEGYKLENGPSLESVVRLFSSRCTTLKEMAINSQYLYQEIIEYDSIAVKNYLDQSAKDVMLLVYKKLSSLSAWQSSDIKVMLKEVADELQIGMSQVAMPLRVAITGQSKSPSVDAIVYLLGRSKTLTRIKNALRWIS